MNITIFKSLHDTHGTSGDFSWSKIHSAILKIRSYDKKEQQPLIKLGVFTNNSRAAGANLATIEGIELDYDAGQVSTGEAANLLKEAGIKHVIYSTYTSEQAYPKWRVLIPLSKPYKAVHRRAFVYAADKILGEICASESYRDKQVFFLGRNPNAGYEVIGNDGVSLDLVPEVTDLVRQYAIEQEHMLNKFPIPTPKRTKLEGHVDVYGAFNDAYDVGSLLQRNGYTFKAGRFIAPLSSSGTAGVVILKDQESGKERAYSHHQNDLLANGKANDAFDVFRILEHKGSDCQAYLAAGCLIFVDDGVTVSEQNNRVAELDEAKKELKDIAPDTLDNIVHVAKSLIPLGDSGYDVWQEWGGHDASRALWNQLATQRPYKLSYLKYLNARCG